MKMLTLLQSVDYTVFIAGCITFITAYYTSHKQNKSSEISDVKDYYVNLVKELNIRNKNLSDKIELLESRIVILEDQNEKFLNKLLVARCIKDE
jgi:hypothetical protein